MKYRLWVRRMSISAPKMTIRSHLPWHVKVLMAAAGVAAVAAIAYFVVNLNQNQVGGHFGTDSEHDQVATLSEQVKQVTAERDRYSSTADSAESQLNIQRAAQNQLSDQIKSLENENAKLKEDLAFFEKLLPNNIGAQGITIQRLQVEQAAAGQLRYRLLAMQGQNGAHEFAGNLQFLVTVMQQGQSRVIAFPDNGNTAAANAGGNGGGADAARFRLSFKYYQRLEGNLVVPMPAGAVIKSVQARVLEKGQVRAQQVVNL